MSGHAGALPVGEFSGNDLSAAGLGWRAGGEFGQHSPWGSGGVGESRLPARSGQPNAHPPGVGGWARVGLSRAQRNGARGIEYSVVLS